jgi:hypothetical protein
MGDPMRAFDLGLQEHGQAGPTLTEMGHPPTQQPRLGMRVRGRDRPAVRSSAALGSIEDPRAIFPDSETSQTM